MKTRALALDQTSQQLGVISICGILCFLGFGLTPLVFTHQFNNCSFYFVAVLGAHAPDFGFDFSDGHGATIPHAPVPSNPHFLP
jgi:hypothetical protein